MTGPDRVRVYCWAVPSRWRAEWLARELPPLVEPWGAAVGVAEQPCPAVPGQTHYGTVLIGSVERLPDLSELPSVLDRIERVRGHRVVVGDELRDLATLKFTQR